MLIPRRLPGYKPILIILGIIVAVWLPFEGVLWRTVIVAVWATLTAMLSIYQRLLGGRLLLAWQWVLSLIAAGVTFGLALGIMLFVLMSVKTGVHGHGPEYSLGELNWVRDQIALWMFVGALSGLGGGLISLGWRIR